MFESEKGIASAIVVLIIVIIGASIGASAYIAISPKPDFVIRELTVAPPKVAKGNPVTVEVEIANVGDAEGTHEVKLRVDSNVPAKRRVTLGSAETKTVSFDLTKEKLGNYTVVVGDLSKSFEVVEPAEFELSNLSVSPSKACPEEPVNVSVDVRNVGDLSGEYTVELKIDGMIESTRTIILDSGENTTISFTVQREAIRAYSVNIANLSKNFEVVTPPKLEVSNFQTRPSRVIEGEYATVLMDVKNNGELEKTYGITLKTDDKWLARKEITLPPNTIREVNFSKTLSDPGTYYVTIDNFIQNFKVISFDQSVENKPLIEDIQMRVYHDSWWHFLKPSIPWRETNITCYFYDLNKDLVFTFENCANGTYGGYTPAGEDGYFHFKIESEDSRINWWPGENRMYRVER